MSPRIKICKENGCQSEQTTDGFCRLHYLKNWKKIRSEKKKKSLRSLNKYIENIMRRNPDNYKNSIKDNLQEQEVGQTGSSSFYSRDDFDDVVEELGFKEDLDRLIDNIKVDKNF